MNVTIAPPQQIALRELMASKLGSIDPSKFPDEVFDLYSIPAFDAGEAVLVRGREIGSAKQVVAPGDVLLSKIVPHIRRAWIVGPDRGNRIIASGEWIVFRHSDVDPRYLRHALITNSFHAEFMATVSGVGGSLLRARPAHVANIYISLPPMSQQRRIADVLDRCEALLAKRRRALVRLDGLAESTFAYMFMQATTATDARETEPLGDHLRFVTSGGRGWAKFYADRGSRFIRSLDVRMNHIANEDAVFVSPPDNAEARRTRVAAGDVLLTITGSRIGRVAAVPADLEGAYISQHVAILRPDSAALLPRFLAFFLSSGPGGQQQIARTQYGQTKPGLNFEQIRSFQVPVPPVEEQEAFVRRLVAIEQLRRKLCESLAKLEALLGSLQDRAFRGEL